MSPVQIIAIILGVGVTLVAVALGTSAAPAALYGRYAQRWDFAPLTTTIIFSVYAGAALVAVLVTGAISDRFGRKPVLLSAVALILVGVIVLAGIFHPDSIAALADED